MKKLTLIFSFFLICFSCTKKNGKEKNIHSEKYFAVKTLSHAKINNVKGKVVEYSESQYLDPHETDPAKGNKTVYRLDTNGNLLEEIHAGIHTKISRTQNVEIVAIQNWNKQQISWWKTISIVNPDSIVQKSFDKYGKSTGVVKYSLDKKGNIIMKESFGTFPTDEKEKYINDEHGRCIEQYSFNLHYNRDLPYYKTTYKYDKYGNLILQKHYPLNKEISSRLADYAYEYTYDEKGNWIKQYFYEDGQLLWRNQREYIYK